jgi:hypothetical protein
VTPLKAIDRFTSLTIIGMTKIMCNSVTGKNCSSVTPSGTPFSTQFGTPSDTLSVTPSCTKTMGDLEVIISTTSNGRIRDMDFLCARGLQLLSF